MSQRWRDLLFAHWPVRREEIGPRIPAALTLDTFEGEAWVAVTPFRIEGLRFRGLPPIPGTSDFPELNVRTYVTSGGRAGVYFFSLDAGNPLAVAAARTFFHLPYFWSRMTARQFGESVAYSCRRRENKGGVAAEFHAEYRGDGRTSRSAPGSLEHWLTERYCLFTTRGESVFRVDIAHEPWPLERGHARIERNTMAQAAGLRLPERPPLLHFAKSLDVRVWAPVRC